MWLYGANRSLKFAGLLLLPAADDKTNSADHRWVLDSLNVFDHAFKDECVVLHGAGILFLRGFQLLDFAGQLFVVGQKFAQFNEARTTRMLIFTARSLFRTPDSMATPCSVKA
jgi:hypothetical protein